MQERDLVFTPDWELSTHIAMAHSNEYKYIEYIDDDHHDNQMSTHSNGT